MTNSDRADFGVSLTEFFESKGAIELAFHILHGGASFSQLEEETGLSSATLSKRLKEGEHLGLWHTIAKRSSGGTGRSKQKYVGTQTSRPLIEILSDVDYPTTYLQYNKAQTEISEANAAFLAELERKKEDGDISPPWDQPPEPGPEAKESIGDTAIQENISNPFDQFDTYLHEDFGTAESTEEIEMQVQQLIEAYLDNYPREISTEEILSQISSDSYKNNDTGPE